MQNNKVVIIGDILLNIDDVYNVAMDNYIVQLSEAAKKE